MTLLLPTIKFRQTDDDDDDDDDDKDKKKTYVACDLIYKLNALTSWFLFICFSLIFFKEAMSDHIRCLRNDAKEENVKAFNAYCYIAKTFTLPSLQGGQYASSSQGSYIGVGPIGKRDNSEMQYHNYYQWTGYLLWWQGCSFLVPLFLHWLSRDRRVTLILGTIFPKGPKKLTEEQQCKFYFEDFFNHQNTTAIKLMLCHFLNLVNVFLNILFVDWYLGGQFRNYGPISVRHILTSPDERGPDPFDVIFPKMTKCTMSKYGPSGTIQTLDALCVMTVNVFNEKIYLILWFVFTSLFAFTLLYQICALVIICNRDLRKQFLMHYLSPTKVATRAKLSFMLDMSNLGDWMMLLTIARSVSRTSFGGLVDSTIYPDRWNVSSGAAAEEKAALMDRRESVRYAEVMDKKQQQEQEKADSMCKYKFV